MIEKDTQNICTGTSVYTCTHHANMSTHTIYIFSVYAQARGVI